MPAALQCPDCGHQEMLDNVGSAATFRCGGCGRALKVPAQFRKPPETRNDAPTPRPDSSLERTQALPKVPTGSSKWICCFSNFPRTAPKSTPRFFHKGSNCSASPKMFRSV